MACWMMPLKLAGGRPKLSHASASNPEIVWAPLTAPLGPLSTHAPEALASGAFLLVVAVDLLELGIDDAVITVLAIG